MTTRDGGWSKSTYVAPGRRDSVDDVAVARRRAAASFGSGSPTLRSSMRNFVRRYGWRAYALPALLIVTVVALVTMRTASPKTTPTADSHHNPGGAPPVTQSSGTPSSTAPVAPKSIGLKKDTPEGKQYQQVIKHAALPSGGSYTKAGKGTFRVLKGTTKPIGHGKLYRYDVEVEKGIKGVDLKHFARQVDKTLDDSRSWSGHGYRLQRVDSGDINFHVSLTSSMTVRKLCGYQVHVETSCYAPAYSVDGLTVNRVVLNDSRWVRGAATYLGDLRAYRTYMINHEDGHALGHEHAHECLPGGMAPVMMQQTFGLKSATDGDYCKANPWPYPPGVRGTPGAEQPDTEQNNELNLVD